MWSFNNIQYIATIILLFEKVLSLQIIGSDKYCYAGQLCAIRFDMVPEEGDVQAGQLTYRIILPSARDYENINCYVVQTNDDSTYVTKLTASFSVEEHLPTVEGGGIIKTIPDKSSVLDCTFISTKIPIQTNNKPNLKFSVKVNTHLTAKASVALTIKRTYSVASNFNALRRYTTLTNNPKILSLTLQLYNLEISGEEFTLESVNGVFDTLDSSGVYNKQAYCMIGLRDTYEIYTTSYTIDDNKRWISIKSPANYTPWTDMSVITIHCPYLIIKPLFPGVDTYIYFLSISLGNEACIGM